MPFLSRRAKVKLTEQVEETMNMNKGTVVTCEALANFQSKVEVKTAQVGIIGLGYVGLPFALLFARNGFAVSGFDLDASKVAMLQRGESYIRHISETVIAEHVHKKRFQATTDFPTWGKWTPSSFASPLHWVLTASLIYRLCATRWRSSLLI